jgi:hypothetical protein
MKSAIPFAFAAQLHNDAIRDGYRNPAPRPAEPEVVVEQPSRSLRLRRTLHLARASC